jgi:hypothetical protein
MTDIFAVDPAEYNGPYEYNGSKHVTGVYVHRTCGALVAEGFVEAHDAGCQEYHQLSSGQWLRHHKKRNCTGTWCVWHNPMPGPWDSWPQRWDAESKTVMRACEHDIEHPDPSQFDYWAAQGWDYLDQHVCCGMGCVCAPPRDATAVIAIPKVGEVGNGTGRSKADNDAGGASA